MKSFQGWDQKIDEVMAEVKSVRDEVMAAIRKSDEARDKQYGELLDMIRALQGKTPQSRMDGPPFDDPPFDDGHGGDFSPGRTGAGQDRTEPGSRHGQPPTTEGQSMDTVSGQRGQGATEREEVPGDTEIAEAAQVPPPVLPDSTPVTETALVPWVAPGGSELPLGQSPSLQSTPPPVVDPSEVRPLKRIGCGLPIPQSDTRRKSVSSHRSHPP